MSVMFVVSSQNALRYILDNSVMAFKPNVKTGMLTEGVEFAIYTTRGAYGNPTNDFPQLLALGRLASDVEEVPTTIDGATYPKRCRLSIDSQLPWRDGLDFRTLIDDLPFVGGPKRFPSVVHRTIVAVPEKDFAVIRRAVRESLLGAADR